MRYRLRDNRFSRFSTTSDRDGETNGPTRFFRRPLNPVYTTQPVVNPVVIPVWQPVVSCRPKRSITSNGSPYATGPLSCLSCLSLTLVYCGQMVGWIKMSLGTEVGLGPGNIVLDGDPAPTERGTTAPHFSAHVYCDQTVAHLNNSWAPFISVSRSA